VSKFIHAEDVIVPYGATDLASFPRITHRIDYGLQRQFASCNLLAFIKDIDLPESGYGAESSDEVTESIDDIQGVHPSSSSSDLTHL
jgi:hypothetical protein